MAAVAAFLVLVLLIIPIEHLAFGLHPAFKDRELLRRVIGIGTVMALGLIPVYFGGLDVATWFVLLAGFVLAGLVLVGMTWIERRQGRAARLRAARGQINDLIQQYSGERDR